MIGLNPAPKDFYRFTDENNMTYDFERKGKYIYLNKNRSHWTVFSNVVGISNDTVHHRKIKDGWTLADIVAASNEA